MNIRDNTLAVLRREEAEKLPILMNGDVMPLGAFERELRNMGLGLCLQRDEYWLEEQNVTVEKNIYSECTETIYRTPFGAASCKVQYQSTQPREADQLEYAIKTQLEYMIKTEADYDVATYIIENTVVHYDDSPYLWAVRNIGEDGIVIGSRIETPYEALEKLLGRQKWISEQRDHPHEFQKLLRVYEKKTEEICSVIADSQSEIVLIGSIRERYDPEQFRKYCLPHLKKYVHIMRQKGKIVGVRARSQWLNSVTSLIPEAKLDLIESFPPPPAGKLSLVDAREEWGDDTVIWINFPNEKLHSEANETYRYTSDLIRTGAPANRLIIGLMDLCVVDPTARDRVSKAVSSIIDSANVVDISPAKSNRPLTKRINCAEGSL